jgi:hypothetical protein
MNDENKSKLMKPAMMLFDVFLTAPFFGGVAAGIAYAATLDKQITGVVSVVVFLAVVLIGRMSTDRQYDEWYG